MLVAKDLNDEDASESRRKFLKFYVSRTSNMPDTSDKSFDELIKDVKSEYLKLDPDTKYDVRERDHKIVELIGEQTEFDKKFYALPEERQKAYEDFYGDAETGKEKIRAEVKMHLKDPELFKIMLLKFKDYEVVFGKGSKEASEFLKFFTESIDNLKSDSDEELKKHREDVLEQMEQTGSAKTQKEAKEYAYDLKDFIEKYD
ncbi:hypothetical protein M3Y97_00954000 [Aphelenchoides bicaudatus]|nr:hypothetical protein M3Y97_00954000 [Aphelenchoides bicaudatus]